MQNTSVTCPKSQCARGPGKSSKCRCDALFLTSRMANLYMTKTKNTEAISWQAEDQPIDRNSTRVCTSAILDWRLRLCRWQNRGAFAIRPWWNLWAVTSATGTMGGIAWPDARGWAHQALEFEEKLNFLVCLFYFISRHQKFYRLRMMKNSKMQFCNLDVAPLQGCPALWSMFVLSRAGCPLSRILTVPPCSHWTALCWFLTGTCLSFSHSASHAHQLYTSQTQSSSEISLGLWIKSMFVSPLWMALLGLCYTNVAKKQTNNNNLLHKSTIKENTLQLQHRMGEEKLYG